MSKLKKISLIILIALVVIITGVAIFWNLSVYKPMPEALAALASTSDVTYSNNKLLVFEPKSNSSDNSSNTSINKTGFIFYPGGLVDPRAYAPMAKSITEKGYLAIIVPMTLNLAVLSPDAAGDVTKAYPEIKNWVIGGHSLGGVMAASYANKHQDKIKGLVFMASYPIAGLDLTQSQINVLSLYGREDGFVKQGQIEDSKKQLPPSTKYIYINGGNHSQFGWYGLQKGDNKADISRVEQQKIVINAIASMLFTLRNNNK